MPGESLQWIRERAQYVHATRPYLPPALVYLTFPPLPAEYLSTTIVLDVADSAFGDTASLNEATSSGLTTSDSGKTWTVDTISINAYTYP